MSEKHVYSFELAGRPLTFEMGELAKQANASVLVRYGDTVVLTAAVASKEPKDIDFFPLTIGYEERLYAVGKVPGGFIKREGRPSEHAILAGRLIDRPIRPLFPDGFRNDVQVINYVMSVDHDNSPEIAAMIGSSLALSISDIPFEGPIAGVVVGRINGEFVLNPTVEQLEQSDIDLTVAGTKDAVNMVEAGAKEVPEKVMLEAIMFGHDAIKEIIRFQEQIVAEIGKEKMELNLYEIDPAIFPWASKWAGKYAPDLTSYTHYENGKLIINANEMPTITNFDDSMNGITDDELPEYEEAFINYYQTKYGAEVIR